MAQDLSPAKCILLTAHHASKANIKALQSFTPSRSDTLTPELILRILLTFLPETTEPREYVKYIEEVASRLYLHYEQEDIEVDLGPVKDLTDMEAEKRRQKLRLCEITPPKFPLDAPDDLLTRFLCHRSYRINEAMGSLKLVQGLVEPFLAEEKMEYLRTWYVSLVLPLLRREEVYYPPSNLREDDASRKEVGLSEFEAMRGQEGTDFLLQRATEHMESKAITTNSPSQWKNSAISRDVKGIVGPWMYGYTERKRRKLRHVEFEESEKPEDGTKPLEQGVSKIQLEGIEEEDKTGHAWQYVYQWMVQHAVKHFPLITICVEEWDGPSDVDLGGFVSTKAGYLDDELQQKLKLQYAQAAFATCYAATANTHETIRSAHVVLARLAKMLDFIPPPDLATAVDSLPKLECQATRLDESQTHADLEPNALLKPDHPLTTPRLETYILLQMMVFSAFQFSGLGFPISLAGEATLHFYADHDEQLAVLRQILRGLIKQAARQEKDEIKWEAVRAKLVWLWNWGIEAELGDAQYGAGVLGKIERSILEEEMLKCFTETEREWTLVMISLEVHIALSTSPSLSQLYHNFYY